MPVRDLIYKEGRAVDSRVDSSSGLVNFIV